MTSKENPVFPEAGSKDIVQLWTRDSKNRYQNVVSDFVTTSPPRLMSGGILSGKSWSDVRRLFFFGRLLTQLCLCEDDMGLGKTLQIISLIITGGPGSTLIVAPVSVMSNWEQQIQRHVKQDQTLSVFIYHGDKKATAEELMNYDVVVTSYGKLAREREAGVRKVLLSPSIQWRRAVLDEGHTIRNSRTKLALAACEINAKSRWVLTGTPMYDDVP